MASPSSRPVDWEQLVNENENRLYRAALAILGDPGEAEDAVQETFLKFLEKQPRTESPAHTRNWLMRVTVNDCRSRLRSPWRTRRTALTEDLAVASPEERQELEELMTLSPRERAAVHLHYYEGYTTAEIAPMLGVREVTVRSLLSRARGKLRVLLTDEEAL